MAVLLRTYDYFVNEIADPRVKDWPLMSTPIPVLWIVAAYLALVYVILPIFMANRKAYNLKNIIFYYNIFQIVACAILIYGIATSGWTTHYTFGCQIVDYSDNPMAVRMLKFVYFTLFVKMIELVETMFFILRKKFNQVSKLHVYHHASTLMLAWITCKYVGGGMATLPIIINSFVHVVMYAYYMLSTLGPSWQKRLATWKPKLTMLQMVQFCILILHSAQAVKPDCHVPKQLLYLYIPNVLLIFYMFWNFYKKSYLRKTSKLSQSNGFSNHKGIIKLD